MNKILLLIFIFLFISLNFLAENPKHRYRFQQGQCAYNAIYNQKSDIDLLIIGGSRFWTVMNPQIIQKEMEKKYFRKLNIVSLSRNWSGPDYSYVVLRDLLERRKVKKILIMAEPKLFETYHLLFYSIAKFKDRAEIIISNKNQNLLFNISDYLKMTFKQLLDLSIKSNIKDKIVNSYGYSCLNEVSDGVYVNISKSYRYQYKENYNKLKPIRFDIFDKEYSHSRYFFRKIKDLSSKYDTKLIFFHLPRLMDPLWDQKTYQQWEKFYSSPIIKLPNELRDTLYNNYSFYDGAHLNKNGMNILLPWLSKHEYLKF